MLSRIIKDAGLLERRKVYYWLRIALNVVLVAAAGFALYLANHTWWVLLVAVYFAIVSTQLAFTGHEAGHRQMFRSRQANEVAGYLHGNLMIGLSYDWWVDKHNRHHRNPNQAELDPDVGTGAFAFSREAAAQRGRIGKFAARWQSYYFFPLLTLEALNLKIASIRAVAKTGARNRGVEATLLFVHVAGYITLLLLTMSPLQALAFLGVHQALFGIYLGCSFAPNHKGMKMLTKDEEMDFLRRQVLTSRNVTGGVPGWRVAGRPELADRAPPVPLDAAAELAARGADRAGVLRDPRPALRRGVAVPLLPAGHGPLARRRREHLVEDLVGRRRAGVSSYAGRHVPKHQDPAPTVRRRGDL